MQVDELVKANYKMLKSRKDDAVVTRLKRELDEFKQKMPLIAEVSNPALEQRHWAQIFAVLGQPFEPETPFCVKDLIGMGVVEQLDQVQVVGATATKEFSMLQALDKMEAEWQGLEFRVLAYKDTGTFIIGGTDEVQMVLDDQIVKIQAMNASPFVKPFKDRASSWEELLQTLQDMLDNWLQCQATWLYLEPIFSSADIVKQMPEEGDKFRTVDDMWRTMMHATHDAPAAIPIAREKERVAALVECNQLLEEVQKGLAAYLEKKRLFFPRFFFLSNDEMLEILSETKDPTRVQPHLKKCFEGIANLDFDDNLVIRAMNSVEKERVPFKVPVDTNKARGAVEKWLVEVEERMFQAIHDVTARSILDYAAKPRHQWVLEWPGMVVLVVTAVYWTRGVTQALTSGSVPQYAKQCTADLMRIVDLVRGELTGLQRATLGALVVMDVHARDVVDALVTKAVTSNLDFEWQAQLRSYWEEDSSGERDMTTMMRMMSASIQYGYEYLGNSSRLVITPLTDSADSLDYLAMGKFFKGLAASGAWACFDEFNRIDLEVLSVVAQQVLDIQRAISARLRRFVFEGTDMQLKWSAWCSITMNPGYAGRSELPDNLKALFRTVAMMVPDYAMIAEIMLFSYGYLAARECSKKIVQCYKLCSEQLSSQDHYDYGMRAVMAVLRAAGNLKRRYPEEDEFVLMLRSIIDVNLCKFLSHDVPLFQGIISDLFPGVVLPKADYAAMEAAMRDACAKRNLQPTEYFLLKSIQLYEMIVVRHGLMIVGLPFSGKTASYQVLADALTLMEERGQEGQSKAEYHVINPKSITMGQLYGQFDPVSHEWTDGILAVTFRAVSSNPAPHRKWLVLDGPVDAIWIENMNTVLDDNKKLCLNSGEIIQMSASMSMIFEVADLAVASPATVSRCGMVYLEPHQLGWRPLTLSWLTTLPPHLPPALREHLLGLFDWLVPVSLRFVRRELQEACPTLDANLVTTLMRCFTSLSANLQDEQACQALGEAKMLRHVESVFVFALVWSVGGTCATNANRNDFDRFLRHAVAATLPDYASPSGEILPGSSDPATVYDFFWLTEDSAWATWATRIDTQPIPANTSFRRIIVPSVDTVRYTFLLDAAVRRGFPALIVGPTGTGKSVMVHKYLYSLPGEEYVPPNIIGFSARTTANMTQYLIDAKLDRRRKGVFGPPSGKKAVIFVDDLNMPSLETYGAQPPIELLRQYMDHGGWFDRQNTFRRMDDCQFVAAMGPPGGGRNHITSRYARHFNVISITDFNDATLRRIFGTLLDWALHKQPFPSNIKEMRDSVVDATLAVYKKVMASLLPTPTKSHYTFNLRDISRVMQGFLLMGPQLLGSGLLAREKYLRLWVHEILRVFYDRLVDRKDRSWFLDFLKQMLQSHFQADFDRLFGHLAAPDSRDIGIDQMRSLFFGDYMDEAAEEAQARVYDEVTDTTKLMVRMEEFLTDHNAMSKRPMNLAIFLYAAEHVSRITRILKQPGAHMLCVGVGGSGRQSLSRLAAFISGMETFQIEISKSYNASEWREDLKRITRHAGAEGKPAVFMFSDSQIKQESFVEDINNLLNSGEVPNMFPYDERAAVLEQCRQLSKKEGLSLDTAVELWNFFVDKTRANLHIVLCFSPIGDAFRNRLRQFPSLVNCCTIDWFSAWPNDALEAVALKFLNDVDVSSKQRGHIMSMCKMFHEDVRELSEQYKREAGRTNYVTPTSYLELITAFTTLLGNKRAEVMVAKKRYEVGLQKLAFTAEQVVVMQEELTALKPNLIRTVAETERLMTTVQKEKTEVVEPKKAIVDEDVAKAEGSAAAANAIKTECEEALAEAIPILESAIQALDTIKPADIKLVQSFKNPPSAIKLVMEAVCVLLDVKPTRLKDPGGSGKMIDDYWPSAQKVLTDPNFLRTLKEYDKDNVQPKIIERIRKEYTSLPDFNPANAAKASSAAEGLCKWVCAMDSYDKVAKVVAPKRAALAEAEAVYGEVMTALKAKQADLKEVMDRLGALEGRLEHSMAEKLRLESEVELCTQKLDRAEKLITGLGGEKMRWTDAGTALGVKYDNLTGDMLISAGVISYLGSFTMAYREQAVSKWVEQAAKYGIPRSAKFSLTASLGDPVKIRAWGIAGLPNDSFSIDNGIMVANARRWPLMIDPQTQANKWIKAMERPHDLRVLKLTDADYMRTLENAVQFGIPVLLENVGEELDPSLEPLLLKQLFKQGGLNYIRLGDTTVEFSDSFRFYITTALRNPHYLPETSVKVTLLNFMITTDGLADQLLGVVVAQERPDLEAQRQQLVVESAENKRKLKEIEDKILSVLSSSQGNILEDASAIQILSEAKLVSNDITEKEVVAEQTQAAIDEARVGFSPCGAYNAVLFFCIRDMAGIDPMYQYSLAWFIALFTRSIQASERSEDLGGRLRAINDHFTYALYQNICRSLFEKDKLLFAFLLCARIMLGHKELDNSLFQFLLTGHPTALPSPAPLSARDPPGGLGIAEKEVPHPDHADWLSAKAWGEVCRAAQVSPGLHMLPEDIARNTMDWAPLFDAGEPHTMALPMEYEAKLTPFERLLLLRMLRPDKVVPAIQMFVAATLGTKFTEPPPFDLAGSYKESSNVTPLLFVLSTGSDPTAALLTFAQSTGYSSKIVVISMGQGQGPRAAALIDSARKAGSWVLLQNCHLAPSWMASLEKICESIKPENTDPDFRLWMTSLPSPTFPVTILQSSIKMSNEPPAGLRANLRRSYALDPISNPEFFESCPKPRAFKALLYGLAFMHAFVQERRKFGPMGWNIPYGFDDGDLRISVRQLHMYLAESPDVPFDALKYSIGECNYGGRVTDDKDRRLLNTILSNIYRPEILTEVPFKLSASGTYVVPLEGDYASYLRAINMLPVFPQPEAFGLHENADISKDLAAAQGLLDTLILTGGAAGGSGGAGNDEELVAGIVTDLLARLPADFDIEKAQLKYPVRYEQSLNQVLCQEMLRYNRLLLVIRASLVNLDKALQGLQVMSAELDTVFRSMAVGAVPALWRAKSFPSLKPLASYVKDLLARLLMLQDWYDYGQPPVFWISGFFFTPSFTTAALQNYARRHKLPIDSVGYEFVMMGTDPAAYLLPPLDGVYIHGLFLEGCGWDAVSKQLCESTPKVYRTAERRGVLATTGHSTNFMMMMRMPSAQPESQWILRGVCMLCSLSE
ncbi:dynein heavy chain 5 [Haematococcus lacustris]